MIGSKLIGIRVRLASPESLRYRIPAAQFHGDYADCCTIIEPAVVYVVALADDERIGILAFGDIDLSDGNYAGGLVSLDDLLKQSV